MDIIPTFQIALQAMRANKVRTGLTVLGMVIGIASVIIVFSAGEGINSLILGEVESFGGSDMVEVEIKVPSTQKQTSEVQAGMNMAMGVQVTTLTLDDMEDINGIPNVIDGYGGIMGQDPVSYGNELHKAFLLGVTIFAPRPNHSGYRCTISSEAVQSTRIHGILSDHSIHMFPERTSRGCCVLSW